MKLIDVITQLKSLDESLTIYAEAPWQKDSTAMVRPEPDDGSLPPDASKLGCTYFLEVSIARDFLDDWSGQLSSEPTQDQKCLRVIEYAINDA